MDTRTSKALLNATTTSKARKLIAAASLVAGAILGLPSRSSAATYEGVIIRGNSCVSITSGQTAEYTKWGVDAPGASAIDVTCPVVLPDRAYTYAYLLVNGYNRSSDRLSCTISATDYAGGNQIGASATLQYNQQPVQVWSASISPTPSLGNNLFFVTCHLPAVTSNGKSHLTFLWLYLGY